MKPIKYFLHIMLLLVAVSFTAPVFSQSSQYALYNYRNDGNFNAWLNLDIEKITFSCIDTLGVEHDDIVVQEVWTADSVYRIPLEAIDSIGFRAPETKMREGIFYLRDYHAAHTTAVDDLTLYFDTNIHVDSIPSIGQPILSSTEISPYEEGFSGKVVSVERESDYIKVICDYAGIGDFYNKLVLVGEAITESEAKTRSRGLDDIWGYYYENGIKPIKDIGDLSFDVLGGMFTIKSKKPDAVVKYTVYIDEGVFLVSADVNILHHDLTKHINISRSKVMSLSDDVKSLFDAMNDPEWFDNWLDKYMKDDKSESEKKAEKAEEKKDKAGEVDLLNYFWKNHKCELFDVFFGPFRVQFELAPMLKAKWDAELDWEFSTRAIQSMHFQLSGNSLAAIMSLTSRGAVTPLALLTGALQYESWAKYEEESNTPTKFDINGKISLTAGLAPKLIYSLIHKNILHANLGAEVGVKATGALDLSLKDIETKNEDENVYALLKDTKIKSEFYIKICPELGVTPSKFLTMGTEWEVLSKDLGSLYLFPQFTEPTLPEYTALTASFGWGGYSPTALSTTTTKSVMFPGHIGIGLYDSDGKRVYEKIADERYWLNDNWDNRWLQMELKNLPAGTTYTARPLFKNFFGIVPANPSSQITISSNLDLSTQSLKMGIGKSCTVEITGGWGLYELWTKSAPMIDAKLSKAEKGNSVVDVVEITAKEVGQGILVVYDKRTEKEKPISIEVVEDYDEPLQLSESSIDIYVNTDKVVDIKNGSGEYEIINDYPDIISADINGIHVAHSRDQYATRTIVEYEEPIKDDLLYITGKKIGNAVLKIKDKSTDEIVSIDVAVINAPSLTLAKNSVELSVGDTENVEILTGSEWYEITTEQSGVISVHKSTITSGGAGRDEEYTSYTGIYAVIEALSVGETFVTVKDLSSGEIAKIKVKVNGEMISYLTCPDENHPHVIDLGIGVKFSCCNVGASAPWEHGDNYAWGEIQAKDMYTSNNYIYGDGSDYWNFQYIGREISGSDYDVAHVKWGGGWRMPTIEQLDTLLSCSRTWTSKNGVDGLLFTGQNGGSIFLPITSDFYGGYWSSVSDYLHAHSDYDARSLGFNNSYCGTGSNVRSEGLCIRPVFVDNPYAFCPDDHHPHIVDLGLPSGKKWSCCNVNAFKPEDIGGLFPWGEIEEKSDKEIEDGFLWGDYSHSDGSWTNCHYLGDISGTQYDVAHVKWGNNWCMPKQDDYKELFDYCKFEWMEMNGINGIKITGTNGNNLFMTANSGWESKGEYGEYWSSIQHSGYMDAYWGILVDVAYSLFFTATDHRLTSRSLLGCLPVRPVYDGSWSKPSDGGDNGPHGNDDDP